MSAYGRQGRMIASSKWIEKRDRIQFMLWSGFGASEELWISNEPTSVRRQKVGFPSPPRVSFLLRCVFRLSSIVNVLKVDSFLSGSNGTDASTQLNSTQLTKKRKGSALNFYNTQGTRRALGIFISSLLESIWIHSYLIAIHFFLKSLF